ncbi:MAG: TonB-dependent receptor, partial [Candidatus Binatia bacterium]
RLHVGGNAIERAGALDTTALLGRRLGSVHLPQTQTNPFQPDLTVRGFTASPLLGTPQGLSVFQDGVRLNEFLGDTVNWDLVPQDAIASLQLAPGADPVYGRNTLGSAVAFQTRRGRTDPGTVGELSAGSFDRRRLLLRTGGVRGEIDYFLLGNLFREDGFRDHSESELNQAFGSLGWRRADTEVRLTYTAARNELRGNGFAPESFLDEDRTAVFTQPDVFEPALDFVHLSAAQVLGTRVRLDANAWFRRLDVAQANADELDEDDGENDDDDGPIPGVNRSTRIDQERAGGSLQLGYSDFLAGIENSLALGVDFDRGRGDLRLAEQRGFLDARRTVVGAGPFEPSTDVETDGEAAGAFVTDTLTPRSWISLTLSARYDRNRLDIEDRLEGDASGEHVFDRVSPAAGVTLRPHRRLHVFARYGESFRSPTAVELTCAAETDPCPLPVAFAEDPPLDEVRARSVEAGVRAKPFRATNAAIAFFRTDLDDDILFVSTGRAEGFFRNVERTRRQGLEFLLDGRLRDIDWFASYAWTRATFETTLTFPSPLGDNTAGPGDELPGVPEHLAKLGFDAPLGWRLRLGFDVTWTGEQFLRTDEANRLAPLADYAVANAGLSWAQGPFTLFARAENLFDAEYESFGTRAENVFAAGRVERFLAPGAPLGGWFGVRVRL